MIVPLTGSFARAERMGQFVEAVVLLAFEAEALALGVWSHGLAGHTGIDRI